MDNVYFFTNLTVNRFEPKPGVVQTNRLSLFWNNESEVVRDTDPSVMLMPELKFDFEPLANFDLKKKNDVIDIIAICESYGPVQDQILRNNVLGRKRQLSLVDETRQVL